MKLHGYDDRRWRCAEPMVELTPHTDSEGLWLRFFVGRQDDSKLVSHGEWLSTVVERTFKRVNK